jgi:hypothetical protein
MYIFDGKKKGGESRIFFLNGNKRETKEGHTGPRKKGNSALENCDRV